jgi:predicted phage terminase large subunit-like protein
LTAESLNSELDLLLEKKRRIAARKNLLPFTEYTTLKWSAGKIHREICKQLDRVIAGEIDRLMLLCPPQHGKSQITSRRFPAYVLGRDPTRDVISASATAELAEGFGRDVRNCIAQPEYRNLFPDTELAEDSQAKGRWNTKQGGGYYAVGVGGQLFGRGGMAIVDDPFGSWEEAQSELQREKVWDWFRGTLYNRIRPGQPIIVIQHRMHEDDLAGRLIAAQAGGDKWEIINLPADLDDPPWPERYDRAALERIRANTSPMQWSALFMQNPTPQEGTFFQRNWFRRFKKADLPADLHYYISSDHAPAGTEDGDFNCVRVWGVDKLGDLYMVDGFRHQETMDKTAERALSLIAKYKPMAWFPEDDNNWKAVAGFVTRRMRERSTFCRIEPISPRGADKAVKAQPFQAMASMGRVWLPEGPEGDDVLDQYLRFPAGKHDDEVDTAGTIGRALEQTHAAVVKRDDPKKPRDRWNAAFDDEGGDFNWKTA